MADFGFSPLGIPGGRGGNTSSSSSSSGGGGGGGGGAALLPTITAELRSEFYPLLSTLSNSGSDMSAVYVMELFFTLIRFDSVLHSDERHLFVSTTQQLITRQLQQLHTVQHKTQLLDENIRFVEELMERCAALEALCGGREKNDGEGDEEEEEEEEDEGGVEGAGVTTAVAAGAEDDDDEGGEVGQAEADKGSVTAQAGLQLPSGHRHGQAATRHDATPGSHCNTARSTSGSAHKRRFFSFDEGLNDALQRTNATATRSHSEQQQQHHHHRHRDVSGEVEDQRRSSGAGDGGDGGHGVRLSRDSSTPAASSSASSSTIRLRQRRQQRPPPLPLNLVANASSPSSVQQAAPDGGSRGDEPRAASRHGRRGNGNSDAASVPERGSVQLPGDEPAGRKQSDATVGGGDGRSNSLFAVDADTIIDAPLSSGGGAGAAATPAVVTGVQHALQEHFRQSVKRNLTGSASTLPASVAETALPQAQTPRGKDQSASAVDTGTADGEKERSTAGPDPAHRWKPRRQFSTSQLSMLSGTNNNNATINLNGSFCPGGGAAGSLSLLKTTASGSLFSPNDADPVDTARVWDRTFWGFLEGRTATADLAILLTLLNEGNTALAAQQAAAAANSIGGKTTTSSTSHASSLAATMTMNSGNNNNNNNNNNNSGTAAAAAGGGGGATKAYTKLGGANWLGMGSTDTVATLGKSPPMTAMPSPDCGALPLMEALKRTGSYAELLPGQTLHNLSFASMSAAAAAAAAAHTREFGDEGTLSRLRRGRTTTDATEGDDATRPQTCATDAAAVQYGVGGNATLGSGGVVSVRGGGGAVANLSALDASAVSTTTAAAAAAAASTAGGRALPWVSLEDYARAEEARLHRDFWAHVPAILVTLTEGLMYGGDHRKSSSGGGNSSARRGGERAKGRTRSGAAGQQTEKGETGSGDASPGQAGGEVANATAGVSATALTVSEVMGNSQLDTCEDMWESANLRSERQQQQKDSDGRHGSHPSAASAADPPHLAASKNIEGGDTNKDNEEDEEEEEEVEFVPLHLPSAEALQLLPTFSPLLRNYAAVIAKLFATAPDYARSTQAQHARTLATAAAAAMAAVQQQQLNSGNSADTTFGASDFALESERGEGATAASITTAAAGNVPMEMAGASAARGLARAATLRSSVNDLQELSEANPHHPNTVHLDRRAATAVRGGSNGAVPHNPLYSTARPAAPTPTAAAAAASPVEKADLGLLGEGSRTDVRPVDVVMYALITAVYVQCAVAIEQQQQMQAAGLAVRTATAAGPSALLADGKASPYEITRSPASGCWPHAGLAWPGSSGIGGTAAAPSGLSFAGDGAATDDERLLNLSMANNSLSQGNNTSAYAAASGGRHYSLPGGSGGMAAPQPRGGGVQWSDLSAALRGQRSDNTSFATQHQQQLQEEVANFSFDVSYSPTGAALSFLRWAHDERASGGGAGATRSSDAKSAGVASPTQCPSSPCYPPQHTVAPLGMHFPTHEVLACANEFSWVDLPSVMKAELQALRAQLHATRLAVQRMVRQVRGELALLLFRVLSMVLDWLMPAVNVADARIWLFYRKWCCDLYRVLCTDVALLEEFRQLLNQSGVAVTATAGGGGGGGGGAARSRRGTSAASAMSANATPTYRSLRTEESARTTPHPAPPKANTPVLAPKATAAAAAAAFLDHEREIAGGVGAARHRAGDEMKREVIRMDGHGEGDSRDDHLKDRNDEEDDHLRSFVLPGSSLAVAVQHVTTAPAREAGGQSSLAHSGGDLRGDLLADTASLRAAQALLSDEGKVVPLPRPFLITKLVAATLKGIDADVAESLLWVVGEDTEGSHDASASAAAHTTSVATLSMQQQTAQGDEAAAAAAAAAYAFAEDLHGSHPHHHGGAADNIHSTSQWKSQRPRHSLRTLQQQQSLMAGGGNGGAALGPHRRPSHARLHHHSDGAFDVDARHDVDSDDDNGEGDQGSSGWSRRRTVAPHPPTPAQSPVAANPVSAGGGGSNFPTMAPNTPYMDAALSGSPHLSFPASTGSMAADGPTLVHHHRFRYPSVYGFADVAQLYLSALEDAELLLSSHDPIYASLVLSAADLHLHDLRDRETAAMLISSYLTDVEEERIQAPVYDVLPTSLMAGAEGDAGSAAAVGGTAAALSPTPGRGFSVTRVRQGNAGAGVGLGTSAATTSTAAATKAGAGGGPSSLPSPSHPPAPQQPHVPMVIPSWKHEREKEEFLGMLRILRQIQVFLTQV